MPVGDNAGAMAALADGFSGNPLPPGDRMERGWGMSERGMTDPAPFGRVDADGTVYVKTAAGERAVGSWQAGTPEEGLAHYVRRYVDLVIEVDLLEARLGSGAADASQTLASIRRLRAGLETAPVVGDLDGLAARLDKLATTAEERAGAARAEREAAKVEAVARKTGAGRRGREDRRRGHRLEERRRPAQGDPRRVEDHPRRRQEDRLRAVEALRGRPRRRSPGGAGPTSPPWTRPASRPRAARRSWSPRPRRCASRPSGTPPPTGSSS